MTKTLLTDAAIERRSSHIRTDRALADYADIAELSRRLELANAELVVERDGLRKFAKRTFELADWPEGGDIDGFDFQNVAEECGLLIATKATGPCNIGREEVMGCQCAEFNGLDGFPTTCYRRTALLTGDAAIDAFSETG